MVCRSRLNRYSKAPIRKGRTRSRKCSRGKDDTLTSVFYGETRQRDRQARIPESGPTYRETPSHAGGQRVRTQRTEHPARRPRTRAPKPWHLAGLQRPLPDWPLKTTLPADPRVSSCLSGPAALRRGSPQRSFPGTRWGTKAQSIRRQLSSRIQSLWAPHTAAPVGPRHVINTVRRFQWTTNALTNAPKKPSGELVSPGKYPCSFRHKST